MAVQAVRFRARGGTGVRAAGGLLLAGLLMLAGAIAGCESGTRRGSVDEEARLSGLKPDEVWLEPQAGTGGGGRAGGASSGSGRWAVVLQTFSGENHLAAAQRMLAELPRVAPHVADARMERTSRGSMVVTGRFDSPDDERAKRELERVKAMTFNGRPVFRSAMIGRVGDAATDVPQRDIDLMSARVKYPQVKDLYTVQVAVWGVGEGGARTFADARQSAERYAQELRSRNFESYVYHDPERELSTVTVGLFTGQVIDTESGLMRDDVEQIVRQFPAHLVNGEKASVYLDPKRPERGSVIQRPQLVEVPR